MLRRRLGALFLFAAAIATVWFFLYFPPPAPERFTAEELAPMPMQDRIDAITSSMHFSGSDGVLLYIYTNNSVHSSVAGIRNRATDEPMDITLPIRMSSMTMVYTAAVIHALILDGKLSLDDPISKYVAPELIDGVPNASVATIRQVLNHTSGIPSYATLRNQFTNNWSEEVTLDRMLPLVRRLEATGVPGEHYSYSATGYLYLGKVAERVTGKAMARLYEEIILDVIEAPNTTYNIRYPVENGIHGYGDLVRPWADTYTLWEHSGPAAGLMAPPSEIAKFFGHLFFARGKLKHLGDAMLAETYPMDDGVQLQGLGVEAAMIGDGILVAGHSGTINGYSSFAYAIPAQQVLAVGFINSKHMHHLAVMLGNTLRAVQTPLPETL